MVKFYLAVQFSAIQKTVNRHDRLKSIVTNSYLIQKLNEIEIPAITKEKKGTVLISGGGKFTACFKSSEDAKQAKAAIKKIIAEKLPMLEFQTSIVEAPTLAEAVENGLIGSLEKQKRSLRGFGVTYNPYMIPCKECGEYPSVTKEGLCRFCGYINENASSIGFGTSEEKVTIEKIYSCYLEKITTASIPSIPLEFENIARYHSNENNTLAYWFSDLNSMKQKVAIWLSGNEINIVSCFESLKKFIIDVTASALHKTFPSIKSDSLPFRILIAGGDDLLIAMPDNDIADFCINLASIFNEKYADLSSDDPLSKSWLEEHNAAKKDEILPMSFGAAFLVTSYHTPFYKVFEIGEALMKRAKKESERKSSWVGWKLLGGSDSEADMENIPYHKVLPISSKEGCISFAEICNEVRNIGPMSTSMVYSVASEVLMTKNAQYVQDFMKARAASVMEKSITRLLSCRILKNGFDLLSLASILLLSTIIPEKDEICTASQEQ